MNSDLVVKSSPRKELPTRESRLHIRASPTQKALLARAARRRHLNVSQFVLQACLEAAEKIVREEQSLGELRVSAEEFAWLMEKLEEPPQELPALRRLLAEAPQWNG